jgi:choline dehydrogenase
LLAFPALDPGYEVSGAVFAMKPHSRGRVQLNGPEPDRPLAIDHGFLSDARDADVLAEGVEQLREIAASARVRRYAARELRPGLGVAPLDHARAAARGFFHPVGTCALGAVCDEGARVLGAKGLLVADGSLMPTIPRVNTNLSVIAVAEAVAERLRVA